MHKRGEIRQWKVARGLSLLALGGVVCLGVTRHRASQRLLIPPAARQAQYFALASEAQSSPAPLPEFMAVRVVPDTPLNRRLVEAVQSGDMKAVRAVCAQGASVDTRMLCADGSEGSIPVAMLANSTVDQDRPRFLAIFQWLAAKASDPNAADYRGCTLLMAAVDRDDLTTVKLLIERGANINARMKPSFDNYSALYLAVDGAGMSSEDPSPITLFLLEHGADANAPDRNGNTPLIQAAERGKTRTAKALLAHGADASRRGNDGKNALQMATRMRRYDIARLLSNPASLPLPEAARFGDLKRVRVALDAGAKPEERDSSGRTSLMTAMQSGSVEVAKLLLERGADARVMDKDHRTALHYAALYGNGALATLLLDHGADVNAGSSAYRDNYTASSPLMDAIEQVMPDTVDLLLRRGARMERHERNDSALEFAVQRVGMMPMRPRNSPVKRPQGDGYMQEQVRIVEHLLAHGADARADDSRALYLAARNEQVGMVDMMLRHGANVNARAASSDDEAGRSALLAAVEEWYMTREMRHAQNPRSATDATKQEDIAGESAARRTVQLLLSRGADVNAANERGETPLMEAGMADAPELTQMLLTKGANVNAADNKGRTILMQAAVSNYYLFAQTLLAHKADVDRRDKDGLTALMLAIDDGENARYLANRRENDDYTRTMYHTDPPAVTRKDLPNPNGHPDMVRLLLKNGADPNAAAKDGTMPLILARKNGFDAVIALLKQAGAK